MPSLGKLNTANHDIEMTVKGWLYSFANDNETELEYCNSMLQLVDFVSSPEIVKVISEPMSVKITNWLRRYVFENDRHFVACYFHDTAPFSCHSNLNIEGTNRGLKYSENRVLPSHTTALSTKKSMSKTRNGWRQCPEWLAPTCTRHHFTPQQQMAN